MTLNLPTIKIDKCDGYEEIDVDGWYMVYEDTPGYTMAYFECKEHAEMFVNHINKINNNNTIHVTLVSGWVFDSHILVADTGSALVE